MRHQYRMLTEEELLALPPEKQEEELEWILEYVGMSGDAECLRKYSGLLRSHGKIPRGSEGEVTLMGKIMGKIIEMKVKVRESETINMTECAGCRNKTFVIVGDEQVEEVLVSCAACGLDRGSIEWRD